MWQAVTDAVCAEGRDALWSHPDVVPTSEDIDNPAGLVARLLAGEPEPDEMDQAIADFFREEESGGAGSGAAGSGAAGLGGADAAEGSGSAEGTPLTDGTGSRDIDGGSDDTPAPPVV